MYSIFFNRSAEKELERLPKKEIQRIIILIEKLTDDPFPRSAKKLSGKLNLWRIRSGNYRIIYSVEKNVLRIEIIRIRHRRDVYK